MKKSILAALFVFMTALGCRAASDLTWATPSRDAAGAMPIGNGEVGLNVWTEAGSGDLCLYIARTDSWSEIGRLLKVGRVRISMTPNLLADGDFTQKLDTQNGAILINGNGIRLRIFVDPDSPIAYIDGASKIPVTVKADAEIWRKIPHTIQKGMEMKSVWSLQDAPAELLVLTESADIVSDFPSNTVTWHHRNESSAYPFTLAFQQLDLPAADRRDPFLHRTFGVQMGGRNFVRTAPTRVETKGPEKQFTLTLAVHTAQTATAAEWEQQVSELHYKSLPAKKAAIRTAHWWNDFWNRSHITVTTPDDSTGRRITEAYRLQRWVTACGGRGNYPVKFNGSIFTVDPTYTNPAYDFTPDFRLWGESYWWQNTRLIYHPLLRSGDYEALRVLFDHYSRNLPMFRTIAKDFYGAKGAVIPETSTLFGTFGNRDYGWDRSSKEKGYVNNTYIKNIWSAGPELVALMFDYYRYTGDTAFVRMQLVPMATAMLEYFDSRFPRSVDGVLQITPTQSIETFWNGVVNDMPSVAGVHAILHGIKTLPPALVTSELSSITGRLGQVLPPLPTRQTKDGKAVFGPAGAYDPSGMNVENPELYSIFPFRLCNLTTADRQIGIDSYHSRNIRESKGWTQDGQQAAILGLTDEARDNLLRKIRNNHPSHRFPAIWGPNYDWTPDQCHGGNLMLTLQEMILQCYGDSILLLPAFPKEWGVDFKLRTEQGNTASGTYHNGTWIVEPKLHRNTGQYLILP